MVAWRHAESLPIAEQALALARAVGAREAEVRALTVLGGDLAYLGRGEEGLAHLRQALQLADEIGDPIGLERAYVILTDVLTMLGRPRESAQLAEAGLEAMRRYGIDTPCSSRTRSRRCSRSATGTRPTPLSAAALRGITANFPHLLLILRADVEVGRGDFDAARAHLEAARATLREDRALAIYDAHLAELALWERRWTDADEAVQDGLARAGSREAAQIRVWLCAKGLRAQAELAALARARRDADAAPRLARPRARADRHRSPRRRRGLGDHTQRRRLARPRRGRVRARPRRALDRRRGRRQQRPGIGSNVRPSRPTAAGARPRRSSPPARPARRRACRSGRRTPSRPGSEPGPCCGSSSCSPNARGSISRRRTRRRPTRKQGLEEILGLTPREAEVLSLVARGYTNREIAATLVISVKTASVHVSHILRKLDAPNRLEAAAIAHRLTPPQVRQPESDA